MTVQARAALWFNTSVLASAFILVSSLAAEAVSGAQEIVVPDSPQCGACRVQAHRVVVLDGDGRRGNLPGMPLNVAEDSSGRIWTFFHGFPPIVFDSSGDLIRPAGATGDGPGEFRFPTAVVNIPGDSVLVFDQNNRATLLAGDFTVARTIVMPGRVVWSATVVDWPHRVVVNAAIPTSAAVGWPLHLMDLSGGQALVLQSFGANEGRLRPLPGEYKRLRNFITSDVQGGLWAVELGNYRVSHWSGNGNSRGLLVRRPAWFAAESDLLIGGPEYPPSPIIGGIHYESTRALWVYSWVPTQTYSRAWRNVTRNKDGDMSAEVRASTIVFPDLYKTRIEILDPTARRVVAVADWPEIVVGVLSRNRIATYSEDELGQPIITIVQLRLVR